MKRQVREAALEQVFLIKPYVGTKVPFRILFLLSNFPLILE